VTAIESRMGSYPAARAVGAVTLAAAAGVGVAVASRPGALFAAAALGVLSAGLVFLFSQPRWVLLGTIGLLVAHAVAVLREQVGSPLTMRTLVLLVVLGVLTRHVLRLEAVDWPWRETLVLGFLGAALLLSVAFATDSDRALDRAFEFGDGAAIAVLMALLLNTLAWLRRALWAYALAAAALATVAVVQQVTGTYGLSYGGFANVARDGALLRSTGPIDANYLGQLLVAAGVLALYLALASKRRATRLIAGGLGAMCLAGLAFTFSRGSLLTAVVVLGVVAWLRRVRPWLPLSGIVALLLAGLLFLPAEARERMTALVEPTQTGVAQGDPSVRGRFSENLAAVQMFVDHPYVGVGPDNYPERYLEYSQAIGLDPRREERHPHNLYLEALAEYGLLGALAFFAVLGTALQGAVAARRRLGDGGLLAEGAAVALLVFLVNGLFLQASYSHYLWITIGLAFAAGRLGRRRGDPRQRPLPSGVLPALSLDHDRARVRRRAPGPAEGRPVVSPGPRATVLYVVSRFPTVTETFVVNEWLRMAQRLPLALASLVKTSEPPVHEETRRVLASTYFLPSFHPDTLRAHARTLVRSPRSYLGTLLRLIAESPATPMGGRLKGVVTFWKAVRIVDVARELGVRHVHAHFANQPATAAWVVNRLTGIPYSFTAHANDLFAGPALLEEKVAEASFVAVISEYNRTYLDGRVGKGTPIEIVHCGVDVEMLPFRRRTRAERLLCIGRLVGTKGQADLLRAFAELGQDHPELRLDLIGEGPDRAELEHLSDSLGLRNRVRFLGVLPSERVRHEIAEADVFVLAARPHASGRMDGIPVALMEAMASGAATVSTRLSGIPELVIDGVTGLLVEPARPDELAAALRRLVEDTDLRARLAAAAREHVERQFDLETEVERLARLIRASLDGESPQLPGRVGSVP
jgi:colanic acid/amylovoran biosynthesis glycosyltransferase